MLDYSYLGFLGTVIAAVWSLAWWLNGHFNNIRKEITVVGKELIEKLQYHERHDDQRFTQIQEALTDLRIKNATTDALLVIKEKNKEI